MKRIIKSLLGFLFFRSGLYSRFFRNKTVIVLFHRVNDALKGNPISITESEFTAFCIFFQKYFIVISLSELLEKLKQNKDLGRHLVITFDDGYKDNHDLVAIELKKRNLPACFFISTNFIGSNNVPLWDKVLSIQSEWMNWDDVRSLHAQGFEIGAHTMNHVDLGSLSGKIAADEITGSMKRLNRELKSKVRYFSYPFGSTNHLLEENRERVRQAGFSCCLSALGGTTNSDTDPFYMKRVPISTWYISPYQFAFEVMFARF